MMRSLRAKLSLSHIIPTLLLLPILSLYLLFALEDFYIHGLLRMLLYQAELLREDIEHEVAPVQDVISAQAFLATIAPSTDSHLLILDHDTTLLASTRREDRSRVGTKYEHSSVPRALSGEVVQGVGPGISSEIAYVALPWYKDNSIGGVLRLSYEVDDVRAQFNQLQWLVISGSLIAAAVALTVAAGLATTITRPLRRLSERAEAIAKGEFQGKVQVTSRDEVGLLASSFNRMTERLEDARQARERQLAAIAHELARPITGMRAAVETLRDGADQDAPTRDTLLAGLEEELARLERLIGTLQGVHKRSLEPIRLYCTQVALERLIRACAANFDAVATRAGIQMVVDVQPGLPTIRADEDRLIQVLTNLLDNACKFTPRGGAIFLHASKYQDDVWVSTADTGPGLSTVELQNVFQQFYRGEETRPLEKRGMGLGLAICREIITAHRGEIWAESPAGGGARFTFVLPIE